MIRYLHGHQFNEFLRCALISFRVFRIIFEWINITLEVAKDILSFPQRKNILLTL